MAEKICEVARWWEICPLPSNWSSTKHVDLNKYRPISGGPTIAQLLFSRNIQSKFICMYVIALNWYYEFSIHSDDKMQKFQPFKTIQKAITLLFDESFQLGKCISSCPLDSLDSRSATNNLTFKLQWSLILEFRGFKSPVIYYLGY